MWPNDCPQCTGSSYPTAEQWKEQWPLINDLYYAQGRTLKHIGGLLCRQHNFHAKPRQYKTRFKLTDHSSKRLRNDQYLAMATVLEAHDQDSQTIRFEASRGNRRVIVTPQQIYKELGRSRKRVGVGVGVGVGNLAAPSKNSMTLPEAEAILDHNDIHLIREQVYSLEPGLMQYPLADDYPSPSGSDSGMSVSTPGSMDSCLVHSTCHLDLEKCPGEQDVPGKQLSVAGMNGLINHSTPLGSSNPYEFSFLHTVIDSRGCSIITYGPDADLTPSLAFETGLPVPQSPLKESKRIVCQCIRPFVVDSFARGEGALKDINSCKADAIQRLGFMLLVDPANEYILPCLNEVVTILGTNEKWRQLEEFLTESCRIIDASPRARRALTIPFRYALAHCRDDDEAKRQLGAELPATHRYLMENVEMYGDKHPNVLVNAYYWAWHLLENHQYAKVIEILQQRLCMAQEIKRGLNLMTVNCMAILGRAYAEMNQHEPACSLFDEALIHLDHSPVYQAYRQVIVMRLALSQAKLKDTAAAEENLSQVIKARLKIFGYSNPGTWAPIHAFCDLLKSTGRTEDANIAFRYHDQTYRREQDRQWYRDKGYSIPAYLQDQPSPAENAWSAAIPVRTAGHLLISRI